MNNTLLHKDASQLVGQILREALTKNVVRRFSFHPAKPVVWILFRHSVHQPFFATFCDPSLSFFCRAQLVCMPSRHAVKQRKIGRTAAFCFSTIGLMIGDVWLDSRFRATSFFKLGEEECPVQSVMQYAAEVASFEC